MARPRVNVGWVLAMAVAACSATFACGTNEVDAFRGVIINLGDFSFHQLRVCDHAARVSFPEQRLLEPENFAMFAIKGLEEFLPPVAQFIPPLKPGAVNAIARSINITSPNALQTHEHVALIARPHFLELVR